MLKLGMQVEAIVRGYVTGDDFEEARDRIHALGPEAIPAVHALATTVPVPEGLDLLVMVLADVAYPPSLPAMRRWLESDDLDTLAFPAACALGRYASEPFEDLDRIFTLDDASDLLEEIANWWDSGEARAPTEDEWLATEQARRQRQIEEVLPQQPDLTTGEKAALDADVRTLAKEFRALPPVVQLRLDLAAIRRVLPIHAAYAPSDSTLDAAVAALDSFLAGGPDPTTWKERVGRLATAAYDDACWNPTHHGWTDPSAKAAGDVAQGLVYVLSTDRSNRLQALHYAREAIEYAGYGFAAVRAELDWQLAQVRVASRGLVERATLSLAVSP